MPILDFYEVAEQAAKILGDALEGSNLELVIEETDNADV